ncbi:MAG: hypothetical protein GC134_08115 [Proteobacteria bacterium]|nr:hypothetical protein [Pseudomonadota bacterium]
MRILLIVLTACLAASTAQACMGVASETQTYLNALPPEAKEKPVVAQVKPISTQDYTVYRLTYVEVVLGIKGIKQGEKLLVRSDTNSCARDYAFPLDKLYYIAGERDEKGVFSGSWKGLDWGTQHIDHP